MSSFAPVDYAEAKAAFKPLKRGRMACGSRTALKTSNCVPSPQNSVARRKKAKGSKRAKLPSRKSLVRKIDNLVFQIICLMYAACVECSSVDKPTTGHVLSRRSYSTRWDFRNVFRQCWPCNFKAAMTAAASYHLWFVKKFGVEAFDELYRDWSKGRKYSRLELIALRAEFQAKLDSLRADGDSQETESVPS